MNTSEFNAYYSREQVQLPPGPPLRRLHLYAPIVTHHVPLKQQFNSDAVPVGQPVEDADQTMMSDQHSLTTVAVKPRLPLVGVKTKPL